MTSPARIRVQVSATLSPEDIEKSLDAFAEVGKDLGLIVANLLFVPTLTHWPTL